ncbi:MAG: hypothetical protein V2A66_05695 [Pseudomonadota bacterium]
MIEPVLSFFAVSHNVRYHTPLFLRGNFNRESKKDMVYSIRVLVKIKDEKYWLFWGSKTEDLLPEPSPAIELKKRKV